MDKNVERYWRTASERGGEWLPSAESVAAVVASDGVWETSFEWRISTVTNVRIEPADEKGREWFQVTVKTDQEARCWCPTVDRAVEWAAAFISVHIDSFYVLGWSSWQAKGTP